MYTGRHTRLHIRKNTLSTKDGVVELWTSHTGYTRHAITSSIISQCKNIFPWWGIYESKLRCDTRWALWSCQIEDTILNHRASTMPINLAGMVSFLTFPGISNHELNLSVILPVMLLSNINQRDGLRNCSRMTIIQNGIRFIKTWIIIGTNVGEKVFISKLIMSPAE
jgi:hypothetical protein